MYIYINGKRMQVQRNKGGYFRRGQDIYICVSVHKNMYIYIYTYIYIYIYINGKRMWIQK